MLRSFNFLLMLSVLSLVLAIAITAHAQAQQAAERVPMPHAQDANALVNGLLDNNGFAAEQDEFPILSCGSAGEDTCLVTFKNQTQPTFASWLLSSSDPSSSLSPSGSCSGCCSACNCASTTLDCCVCTNTQCLWCTSGTCDAANLECKRSNTELAAGFIILLAVLLPVGGLVGLIVLICCIRKFWCKPSTPTVIHTTTTTMQPMLVQTSPSSIPMMVSSSQPSMSMAVPMAMQPLLPAASAQPQVPPRSSSLSSSPRSANDASEGSGPAAGLTPPPGYQFVYMQTASGMTPVLVQASSNGSKSPADIESGTNHA